jgi:hypothetical protein
MSKPFVVSGFWLGYAGQVQYRAKRNLNLATATNSTLSCAEGAGRPQRGSLLINPGRENGTMDATSTEREPPAFHGPRELGPDRNPNWAS